MTKIEKLFLYILVGGFLPLAGFLTGWFSSYKLFRNEAAIPIASIAGITAGLILDGVFLKKWVHSAYQSDLRLWMALYIFYSVCVFGFFMGVPVPNLFLAIPAGIFLGGKLTQTTNEPGKVKTITRKAEWFTSLILTGICISSAWLALRDPTTGDNLEGMLRLPFHVTQPMIVALILVGGSGMLAANWWLVAKTTHLMIQRKSGRVA